MLKINYDELDPGRWKLQGQLEGVFDMNLDHLHPDDLVHVAIVAETEGRDAAMEEILSLAS